MPKTLHPTGIAALRGRTAALAAATLLAACAATGPGGKAPPVEPRAGTWKTWVLASATEIRVPTPPDAAATAAELAELQKLAVGRDAATLERIRYWDAGSPAYRWNELAIETSARNNATSVPRRARVHADERRDRRCTRRGLERQVRL